MKLSALVHHLDSVGTYNFSDVEITGITNDSRKVRPGCIFVAIKGYKTDGAWCGEQFTSRLIRDQRASSDLGLR